MPDSSTAKVQSEPQPLSIVDAPPVTKYCCLEATAGFLPETLKMLRQLGGYMQAVQEIGCDHYRVWYRHPEFEDRQTDLQFTRNGATFVVSIRDLGPIETA